MMGGLSKLYSAATRLEDRARAALLRATGVPKRQSALPAQNRRPQGEPLRFLFTIDTEISLGGALDDHTLSPVGADKRIWCQTDEGRFGIERFMDVFDELGMKGVFFFEPFGVNLVEPAPLKEAARHIAQRGHDVELHVHPEFNIDLSAQRRSGENPPNLLHMLDKESQLKMIQQGADMLEAWTGRRPCAFRAGSYGLDPAGLDACAQAGMRFDSSYSAWAIDVGICDLGRDPTLNDVAQIRDDLYEVPVTNLRTHGVRGGIRNFDLASLNTTEMIAVIEEMYHAGSWVACSITHSFRLLKIFDQQMRHTRPDHVNLHRVRSLARYLAAHPDRFQVCTFQDLPVELFKNHLRPPPQQAFLPSPPTWMSMTRLALQAAKDRGGM